MILQAAINGARRAAEHNALPLTLDQNIAAAVAVVDAGANEIHLHLRNEVGDETLRPTICDTTLRAVRHAVPGTLIGVSTGLWIEGNHAATVSCLNAWTIKPDYASLNIQEEGCVQVADALQSAGIGIELGLFDEEDVDKALAAGLIERSFRILVEVVEPDPAKALRVAANMLDHLRYAGCTKSILLHGMDATMWPLFDMAVKRRLSQRLGLEDGLAMPDGTIARDNAAVIVEGRRRLVS